MKLRLNSPGVLIDVSRIAELQTIREKGNQIVVGAMCTHHAVMDSPLLAQKLPLLVEAAKQIGDIQVRNRGTIGGSLAHADPAADWPAVTVAADAVMHIQGPDGSRHVPADEFFTGFYGTALAEDEILVDIHFPVPPAGSKATYQKFSQPASRYALVGCAARLTMRGNVVEDCRLAFSGVADAPYRAEAAEAELRGNPLTEKHIEAAAAKAAEGQLAMADHFAEADYRTHLAGVYLRRAVEALR
jgi:carbon-monoxide dehydrogenase medium subunit